MLYNDQNQPPTPYKKKQISKTISINQQKDQPNSVNEEEKEVILIEGDKIQPECLVGGGSYFNCYIGIQHTDQCVVSDQPTESDFPSLKEKLAKFLSFKEIPNKINTNFLQIKCIKINKEISPCIKCKKEICINCINKIRIETQGCTPICILKNKKKISQDFNEVIKKVAPLSQNLVPINSAYLQGSSFTIQMPYFPLSLKEILIYAKLNNKIINNKLRNKIIKETAKGIFQLNEINLVHNDIKPENILYDPKDNKFLLCDFNVSQEPGIIKLDGNKKYMAKEVLRDFCTFTSDVYSLGLLFLEMGGSSDLFLGRMLSDSVKERPLAEEVVSYFSD